MDPFETSINATIKRFKEVKEKIFELQNEHKILEDDINSYMKKNDVSAYEDCYKGTTTSMQTPSYEGFEIKEGVDQEKIKVELPISYITLNTEDSNGNEIDKSKIKIKIPSSFQEKYPELTKKSYSLKIKKGV